MASPGQHCTYSSVGDGAYRYQWTNPDACEPCRKLAEPEKKTKTQARSIATEKELLGLELQMSMKVDHDTLTRNLPLEITTEIFRLSLPENIADLSLKTLISRYALAAPLVLSGVSRRWRNIVHSTPQLWADLPLNLDLITPDNADSFIVLTKDWLERSDPCLLSINIYASRITNQAAEVIQLVNQYSFRWTQLTYEGPNPALSHFSSSAEGVSQLRTLILRPAVPNRLSNEWCTGRFDLGSLILRPTRLEMKSVFLLQAVNIEWSYLTELKIVYSSIGDCLEMLRRAPRITHCVLYPILNPRDRTDPNHFQLPKGPIAHEAITNLTLIGIHFPTLLAYLLCPSLKTFTVKRTLGPPPTHLLEPIRTAWMNHIVEFVQMSGCPVTDFCVTGFEPSKKSIDSLCEGLPTLHYSHIEWADAEMLAQDYFLTLLARTTIVGDKIEPLYFPELHSLTVRQISDLAVDWSLLPAIFCPSHGSAGDRFSRSKLDCVDICIGLGKESVDASKVFIVGDMREQLLLLREHGVDLRVQIGKDKKDMILAAVGHHA